MVNQKPTRVYTRIFYKKPTTFKCVCVLNGLFFQNHFNLTDNYSDQLPSVKTNRSSTPRVHDIVRLYECYYNKTEEIREELSVWIALFKHTYIIYIHSEDWRKKLIVSHLIQIVARLNTMPFIVYICAIVETINCKKYIKISNLL